MIDQPETVPAITCTALSVSIGEARLLDGVTLDVRAKHISEFRLRNRSKTSRN